MKVASENKITNAERTKIDQSSLGLSALNFNIKIGYDGKRAGNNLTGLGNYSRSLIEHLAIRFPLNEYLIYTPSIKKKIAQLPVFLLKNVKLVLPSPGISKFLWRSIGIKKQLLDDQIQIFHGLSHEIPFGIQHHKIKTVVTMHDLIFLRMPQYYKWLDRKIYRFKSEYACKKANRIIAISEQTKTDIVSLYGIDPNRIDVVYQSCDDRFKTRLSQHETMPIREKYSLPERYILYVGTIEGRKNLLSLVNALPHVDADVKLVVIGRDTKYADLVKNKIKALNLQERVIFLKDVPFVDLPAIYQRADVFVLPSYYEGFGIPIIEALYSGVPVIAAKGSCLEEAGGPHSLYFSPDDHHELADKLTLVLTNETLAKDMRNKGLSYVQRFNNEVVDEQLMAIYLKTLAE